VKKKEFHQIENKPKTFFLAFIQLSLFSFKETYLRVYFFLIPWKKFSSSLFTLINVQLKGLVI